ncbi:MAG: patatin-like phospholipase family protein [Vicinamibacterales bacterium]
MATKHAVVLSGGGAKGAYEIGVMKALLGGHAKTVSDGAAIHPVVYAGTSVGSYNAAYMVSRPDRSPLVAIAELETIWRNRIASSPTRPNGVLRFRFNPLDWLDVSRLLADPLAPLRHFVEDGAFVIKDAAWRAELFLKAKEPLATRFSTLLDFGAFVSTEAFADLVRGTIDLQAIRSNHEQVLIVAATNWEEGVAVLFSNRDKHSVESPASMDDKTGHLAIMASAAIPGVFPAIEVFNRKHVDGGVLLNTPLEPALRGLRSVAPEDEHVLHVIFLDPNLKDIPLGPGHGTMEALNRLFALSFASQVNRDCRQALSINMALEAGAAAESTASPSGQARPGLRETVRMKPGHRYSPLTIHRYSPRDLLGGIFGLLAFNADYVNRLIEQGFQDAVAHDCVASGCIFPRREDAERVKASRHAASANVPA